MQGETVRAEAQLPQLFELSRLVGSNYYIGVPQANAAWLHYRAGDWSAARTQAEAALETWAGVTFPFQWLAHWILLVFALRQNRLPDAVVAAQAMLDVEQQKLPDELDALLAAAAFAWDANDELRARADLEAAAKLATLHGYL